MNRPMVTMLFLVVLLLAPSLKAGMPYEFRFEDDAGKKSLANTGSVKGQAKEIAPDGTSIEFTHNTPTGHGTALRFPMGPAGTTGPAIALPESEARFLLTNAQDEITIAMWVRWAGPNKFTQNTFQALVAKLPADHSQGWAFGIRDNGLLRLMIGGLGYRDSKQVVPVDKWTHVAMVFSPRGTLRLYINGKDAGLDQDLYPVTVKPRRGPIYVGSADGSSLPSNAAIYDLRIYDVIAAIKAQ